MAVCYEKYPITGIRIPIAARTPQISATVKEKKSRSIFAALRSNLCRDQNSTSRNFSIKCCFYSAARALPRDRDLVIDLDAALEPPDEPTVCFLTESRFFFAFTGLALVPLFFVAMSSSFLAASECEIASLSANFIQLLYLYLVLSISL